MPDGLALPENVVAAYVAEVASVQPLAVTYGALILAVGVSLLAVRASAMLTGVFLAISLLTVLALVVVTVPLPLILLAAPVLLFRLPRRPR